MVGARVVVGRGDQGEVCWVDAAGVVAAVGDVEFGWVPHASGLASADARGEDDNDVCVESDAVAALVGELDGWVAGVLCAHCAGGHEACAAACGARCWGIARGCALVDSEF